LELLTPNKKEKLFPYDITNAIALGIHGFWTS